MGNEIGFSYKTLLLGGLAVIIFQMLLYIHPFGAPHVFVMIIELGLFWEPAFPLFFPMLCAILYGLWSRNRKLAFLVGFMSWMAFPIMFIPRVGTPPLNGIAMMLGYGAIYGLMGVLSSMLALKRKVTIALAFLLVIIGLSLWYLAWSHFFIAKFTNYAMSGCGVLFVGLGTTLFITSLGRIYLKVFLIAGLMIGLPVAVTVFREMWMRSGYMIEIGEATPLTFIYYAVVYGMVYGLIAGFLGITAYHIFKTKIWR